MRHTITMIVTLIVCLFAGTAQAQDFQDFLKALHTHEASGRLHPPDGDGGKAIGPYQIWRVYWLDAVRFDRDLGGTYQDCRDKKYAERVIHAYMRRYGREAIERGDWLTLAAMHNGGPAGARKPAARAYARRILRLMEGDMER